MTLMILRLVRHNLPEINVMNDDGTINKLGGKYPGIDRYEARKQIVAGS